MKVIICDPINKKALSRLQSHKGLEVDVKTEMTPEDLLKTIPDYNVMVVRSATKVTKEVIKVAEKLELIVRGGVGLDNIDVEAAEKAGIKVANTPQASSISVAELAMAMIFSLAKKIPYLDRNMKDGKWPKKGYEGMELYGKTLGIIGLGRIGQEVARRALGLGMHVHFRDVRVVITFDPTGLGTEQHPMDIILKESDFITVHTPFLTEYGALLGKKEFEKMKDGVIVVNCARGGVVDEEALLEGLKSGKVAAAGLDVFETEPKFREEFRKLDNVVLTPHIGASTKEAQARVGEELAAIICDYCDSKS